MTVDFKHYQRVRDARLAAGMPVVTTESAPSTLVGCRVMDTETEKTYTILGFLKHWYVDGWIYMADLYGGSGSVKVMWANINCECLGEDEFMVKKFLLLDETH